MNSIAGVPAYYPGYPNPYARVNGGALGYPNGLGVPSGNEETIIGTQDITAGALYGVGATLDGETLILTVDGVNHTLTFNGATTSASEAAMLAAIDAQWPGLITALQGGPAPSKQLVLSTSGPPRSPAHVIVVGAGSSNGALGLTPGTFSGKAATAKPALVGGRPCFSFSFPP